ncbi:unnamed protein product [Trichobilharzia szidati]|nr:unnamed protein product [Trichobilharzia szidati]
MGFRTLNFDWRGQSETSGSRVMSTGEEGHLVQNLNERFRGGLNKWHQRRRRARGSGEGISGRNQNGRPHETPDGGDVPSSGGFRTLNFDWSGKSETSGSRVMSTGEEGHLVQNLNERFRGGLNKWHQRRRRARGGGEGISGRNQNGRPHETPDGGDVPSSGVQDENRSSGGGGRDERRRRQVFSDENACGGASRGEAGDVSYRSAPNEMREEARGANDMIVYLPFDCTYHHQCYFPYYPQSFISVYFPPPDLCSAGVFRRICYNCYKGFEHFLQLSNIDYSLGFYNTQEQQGGYYADWHQCGRVCYDNQNNIDISSDCKENYDPESNNQVEIDLSSSLKHIHDNEDTTTTPVTRRRTTKIATTTATIDHQKGLDMT